MPWTIEDKLSIDISFLLTEDGEFLVQEDGDKIVISYGWDIIGREEA